MIGDSAGDGWTAVDPSDGGTSSGVTLAVLAGLTALMLLVGFMWSTESFPPLTSAEDNSLCLPTQVRAGDTITPEQVVVSVYNAGTHNGAAADLSARLQRRGFTPGRTGSTKAKVKYVQIWADPLDPGAQLVAKQFEGHVMISEHNPPLIEGIVVVIGDRFKGAGPVVDDITAEYDTQTCSPPA